MGKGDRRKSNKMRRRVSREHYKARKARPKAPADKKPKAAPDADQRADPPAAEPPAADEPVAVVKREAPEPAAEEKPAEEAKSDD